MAEVTPQAALEGLLQAAGLPPLPVALEGAEPALPSSFRIGTAAQASIAASAAAAAELHRRRGGGAQQVSVAMRDAAIEFRGERYVTCDGKPMPDPWDAIAGVYRCGDGRYVRLHTNFPHHRRGVVKLLGCDDNRDAVATALASWDAIAFETAAAEAGLCVTAMRTFAEWDAHPHGAAIAGQPPLWIERIGDAAPKPLPPAADRPLAGLRMLEMTRVIAGPVCGRTLAAHGADVLHITSPHLPNIEPLLMDTGRGKRNAALDLRDAAQREVLRGLLRGADVFLQSYRPGGLASLGFSPQEVAALNPGIVCVTLSAFGHLGPWANRRGFDSLTQTASGMNAAEAEAAGVEGPKVLPCQALDHASGYLLALGAMAALMRRAEEGGSWLVRVSLAATGRWIRDLGRLPDGFSAPDPKAADVQDLLEDSDSGFGRLRAVRHAARLAATPAGWTQPAMPLGSSSPAWLG